MSAQLQQGSAIAIDVERVATAAKDALTDEMIGRLAQTAGETIDLLDRINRSGMANALPALAQLVNSGDLERLAHLARVFGAAQDALTDEMIGRIAATLGDSMVLLDRFHRGGGMRVIEALERLESSGVLDRIAATLPRLAERLDTVDAMLGCIEQAAVDSNRTASPGGVGGLWNLLKDPQNQDALRFLLNLGKNMRRNCVAK
jgi:plasmid maintenance system antidote protein VapI